MQSTAAMALRLPPRAAIEDEPDDRLAARARDGEAAAFDQLVRRHQQAALQLAWKFLGDTALAKDACQATFLAVFRGLPQYQPRDRFVFWLRRILINQCRMAARSTHARSEATEGLAREPSHHSATQPDEWLLQQERRKAVEAALQNLSEKLREVVVLRYAGGHSLEEVAQILELPLGTVKSRLNAAAAGLRASLEVPL